MPLVIIKEFETEPVIKGYHAYMNDWTSILGDNLSTCPEPKNEIDKYAVLVTRYARVIGHLKKLKTGWYTKTAFYFLRANQCKLAVLFKKYGENQNLFQSATSQCFQFYKIR